MDIAKALIAGIATILSAILTIFFKDYLDKRKIKDKYESVSGDLRDAVHGKWKGQIHQSLNGDIIFTEVELELKVSNEGAITGMATLPFKSEVYQLKLEGGFYSTWFLKVNYENANRAILQFGTFVFRLSPDSKSLSGHFVRHGHISQNIIAGNATFSKS